ncbi:hypothetical protein [Azospirillum doebereinerae]
MLDARLILGAAAMNEERGDETYWLERLSQTKAVLVGKGTFPLEFAILLFNQDYADLRVCGCNMLIEILPAGLAALQSRRSFPEQAQRGVSHFAP